MLALKIAKRKMFSHLSIGEGLSFGEGTNTNTNTNANINFGWIPIPVPQGKLVIGITNTNFETGKLITGTTNKLPFNVPLYPD